VNKEKGRKEKGQRNKATAKGKKKKEDRPAIGQRIAVTEF
jgi:hypothetical protein